MKRLRRLKKDEFLQRIGEPELTHLEFLRMQVHYIRKGNWLISVVFFLSALFALRQAELELLWPYLHLSRFWRCLW